MTQTTPPASQSVIENWSKFYGIPSWIPLSIAQTESGLNPSAQGDKNANGQPTSFGLFQLHTGGGQGDGFTPAQLQNPNLNAQVGIGHMVTAYQEGAAKNLTGYNLLRYVASRSGHPDETGQMPASYNAQLSQAFTTITGKPATTSATGGTSATSGSASNVSGFTAVLDKFGWGFIGVAIIGLGIWLMFNPFADLTPALRSLGKSAGNLGKSAAGVPLSGVARGVSGVAQRVNGKARSLRAPKSKQSSTAETVRRKLRKSPESSPLRVLTPDEQYKQLLKTSQKMR